MRLHWHPFSLYPRRIRIALAEKRLPYEDVLVDLPGGALRTPDFLRLNPFGQVPVLEDGDLVLYESVAILEYLEETHREPALFPADARTRARARQLMLASGDYLAPPFHRCVLRLLSPERAAPDDQARDVAAIRAYLGVLDAMLADGRAHLLGDFSLADVCHAPFVCELAAVRLGHLPGDRPAVARWIDRLNARPSVVGTRPEPVA